MADLAMLERAFAAALTTRSVDAADVSMLAGPAERARRRLGLYRGNVQVNASKALGNAYPICAKLVGEEFFAGLAFEYAARAPSSSGDLNEYGAGFAAFLEGFAPVAQVPYLPDVARLEWCIHRAHYAADAPPVDIARLAAVSADRYDALTVALHPACALIESSWPLARLWVVHQPGFDGPRFACRSRRWTPEASRSSTRRKQARRSARHPRVRWKRIRVSRWTHDCGSGSAIA